MIGRHLAMSVARRPAQRPRRDVNRPGGRQHQVPERDRVVICGVLADLAIAVDVSRETARGWWFRCPQDVAVMLADGGETLADGPSCWAAPVPLPAPPLGRVDGVFDGAGGLLDHVYDLVLRPVQLFLGLAGPAVGSTLLFEPPVSGEASGGLLDPPFPLLRLRSHGAPSFPERRIGYRNPGW